MDNSGGSAPPPPPPPPPDSGGFGAGAGGASTFGPKGLGDILSTAFDLYRSNAAQLLQLVAVVVVPLSFIQAVLVAGALDDLGEIDQTTGQVSGGFFTSLLVLAGTGLIGWVIQQVLLGALTRGAAGSLIGRAVDVGASYRYALSRLGGLIILALLYAIIVAVGFILLIIPGIIFGVFLAVAMPAFIVERKSASEALSRSWNLVSGSFWHTLGVIVVAFILAGIVNGVISALGGSTFIGSWLMSAVAQVITAPFVALVGVVLYVDLRVRREGLDAGTLQRELDSAQA
jgi:L-cystine uptake protein TcyP (sodium:dicarboxylate symporter family)